MKSIKVNFTNCYGIKQLKYEFNFAKNKNYLIYASNGMMKTSFTKTFKALSLKKQPVDEVFSKKTVCEVLNDDVPINSDEIFVINSYEDEYISPNSAKLMVHKSLREKYEIITSNLINKKTNLIASLGTFLHQDETNALNLLLDFLESSNLDFVDNLSRQIKDGLLNDESFAFDFNDISYYDLFSKDVEKFVKDEKNLLQIKDYELRYNELIEKSPIFKRGVFSHNNANEVSNSLINNGFFQAEHTLHLNGIDKEISSSDDFETALTTEKNKIFTDEKLKKNFDKINSALGKRNLINFRKAIEKHPEIITQLPDFDSFKKKVWVFILNGIKNELNELLVEFSKSQETIFEIKKQAANEKTQWDNVLEIFRARFTAPFNIEVPNKEDVAFIDSLPEFIFKYVDIETEEEIPIQRKELEKVLSQGEKRALFLLNIINDLEVLKIKGKESIIIVDDIAESFDYKNKYAIIEYLQEMMESPNLHFVILTHNFDFFRTVANRTKNIYPQMVQRIKNGIEIQKPKYVYNNPFSLMKKGMKENRIEDIITSIPFVRNLIEYTSEESSNNYLLLTSLLHIKKDTFKITLKQLQDIFNQELKLDDELKFAQDRETTTVYKLIVDTAKNIAKDNREGIDLEGKIILSIAIRLLAEQYMINEIKKMGDENEIENIHNNQTSMLYKLFIKYYPNNINVKQTLNKVLLMSSENIHINSFMFEPLIDMSIKSLINLYGQICIWMQD